MPAPWIIPAASISRCWRCAPMRRSTVADRAGPPRRSGSVRWPRAPRSYSSTALARDRTRRRNSVPSPSGQLIGAAAMPSTRSIWSSSSKRVAGRLIHLVDEGQDRDPALAADLEQLHRLRLDALGAVEHHDRAIHRHEGAVGVFAEVLVARRVEQVDALTVELELERGRGDRNAALLLHLHPVRDGVALGPAASDRPGQLDGSGVQQQLLGQRGLAGVRVRNDGKRAAPGDFARQRVSVVHGVAARRGKEGGVWCHCRCRPVRIFL